MSTRTRVGPARRLIIFLTALATMLVYAVPASAADDPPPTRGTTASEAPASDPGRDWGRPGPGFVAYETGGSSGLYIIQHQAPSLARYDGGVAGLAPTATWATGQPRLDPDSSASRAYLDYLRAQQDLLVTDIEAALGRGVTVSARYSAVLNAVAIGLSPDEALQVSSLPGVQRIERNRSLELLTDNGPAWIGADAVHDGSATPDGSATRGEGVVVGIIDTGINTDHPSFADVGPVDGFDHTNPRLTYLGLCDPVTGAPFCNDKLIGVYDFTNTTPEDGLGHGSHTASTTAGNVVEAEMTAPTMTVNRTISGVAPHANIISYKACQELSGNCLLNGTLGSINQATLDQVDVINFSIGGSSGDPWSDFLAQAFFDANAAGVFVASSAGNSGPGAGTMGGPANAPWVTAVAASTHDRKMSNGVVDMSGGATAAPADIFGKSITAGYGPAEIVYAGDFAAQSNDPGNAHLCGSGTGNPATGEGSGGQPWPAGTFNGEIVVCDRGEYGRVHKGENVLAAGGGGYILANDADSGDSLVADPHVLPAVHISFDDGVVLKAWIADGGSGHTATIQGTTLDEDPANGDVMAGFSSRGPDASVPSVIKPDVTAPGVDILAAYHTPLGTLPGGPAEYNVISGTSMSGPHTAGAGALVRAAHPDWSPDQVKSALMTTAFDELPGTGPEVHEVLKEDGATPAIPFDMGAGRVDLRAAALAGLVFDETGPDYEAANPALGGDPTTLNIASLGNDLCVTSCSWTRTVESAAAASVTWTATVDTPSGMGLTVSPSTFTLAPGATVDLTITADVSALTPKGQWAFAEVTLTPDGGSVPPAHLPVAVVPSGGNSSPTTLWFHGNVHDNCTGDGATDLVAPPAGCEGPTLEADSELDTATAASWGPVTTGLNCAVPQCISDPNWIWNLDEPTTLSGPMTVEWWASAPGANLILFDDFRIRLWADDTLVLEEVVRHNIPVPDVPTFLQSTVEVPETTALDAFVLHVDPIFVNQNGTMIWYDSPEPCPGAAGGACDSRVTVPLVTVDVDDPPVAVDDRAFVSNGGTVIVDVLANDTEPDGDPVTVEIVSGPDHGTADVTLDNDISYTHDGSATTADQIVYRITDPGGQSDTAVVDITIGEECVVTTGEFSDGFDPEPQPGWTVDTAVNADPASQPWQVLPDAAASSLPNSFTSDANGQKLDGGVAKDDRLVSPPQLVSPTTHLVFQHRFSFETGFDGGVLEVSTDGGATWTDILDAGGAFLEGGYTGVIDPSNSGNPLQGRNAWTGGSDGLGASTMGTVDVDLGALAGEEVQVRFRLGLDELTIPTTAPPFGWWVDDVTFTNLFEIDPDCADNAPPVAEDDSATVAKGGTVTVDVLANDSDPDHETTELTVTIESDPSNGTAAVNPDGTIDYTHDGSDTTSDSFQYRITDPEGAFDIATVSITVEQEANEPPVANDDAAEVPRGESVTIDVKANDSDPDDSNDDLTVSIETQPSNGTAGVTADGQVTYTHDGSDTTSDSFEYRITDPDGAFDIATVTITVTPDTGADVDRAHGAGWWAADGEGPAKKVHFSFDTRGDDDRGKLKVKDKGAGVKIDATSVSDVAPGEGEDCNGTELDGDGTFVFFAEGTFSDGATETDDALFRACGDDNGDPGKDGDTFFVECVTGCTYDTGSHVVDDAIDGGNVHVTFTAASGGDDGGDDGSSSDPQSQDSGAVVLELEPILLDEAAAGAPLLLTAVAHGSDTLFVEDIDLTLRWVDADGEEQEAQATTDALGIAAFTIIVPEGEVEFVVWAGDLSSNGVAITGVTLL